MRAPLPENELARLRALERYHVLDTAPETAFDRITQLASKLLEMPMALVSLIDRDRQWFKSCVGVDECETERDVAFCAYAILSYEPLIVEDATLDPRFADNRLVTGPPHVRFYAGAPLTSSDGFNLGTLCILDRRPRRLSADRVETLIDLSRIVVDELELRVGYRARAMFQKVCEASPNLIYLYERAKKERTYLGRQLLEVLGYAGSQSGPERLPELVHPEDLPQLQAHLDALDQLLEGSVELSFRMRDANDHYRWFMTQESAFERDPSGRVSQVVGIATEITALKEAEQRLAESEELLAGRVRVLEGILDSAGEGIAVVDESGSFTVYNPAARRIMGSGPTIGTKAPWPRSYTIHDPKTGDIFPNDRTPLARAMRGIPSDNLELLIKSEGREDRLIRVTGRPLRDEHSNLRGGIITFNDITALRAAEEELARRAVTDPLTGLPNRRAFDERLELLVAEGGRGRQFGLVIGDVDHFKRVNDTYGHALGDQVLAQVALVLQRSVRRTDFVARFGGEEFCVLFTDVDDSLALRLAENLRRAIAEQSCSVPVTISLGVCTNRPNERTTPKTLLETADRALYTAKRQGRNCVVSAQLSLRESMPLVASRAKARA